MTAVARKRPDWSRALVLYRDDGLLARGLARLGSRRVPALAPLLAAALPMAVLLVADGDEAPRGRVALAVAWAVLAGGISRGCSHEFRLAWLVPPAMRALEYGSIFGIAAATSPDTPGAAYALVAVVAFRHYDLVYRLRQRGDVPPAWVNRASGGWDGRLVVTCLLMLAGLLPAAVFALAGVLAVLLVGESVHGWVQFARAGHRVTEVDDGEEEG
jgi:Family of unknown function (DUF5941)